MTSLAVFLVPQRMSRIERAADPLASSSAPYKQDRGRAYPFEKGHKVMRALPLQFGDEGIERAAIVSLGLDEEHAQLANRRTILSQTVRSEESQSLDS